jgi:hypothetical protein
MPQTELKRPGSGVSRRRIFILAGIVLGLVGIGVVAALARGSFNKGGDRKACAANMRAIGQACINYANSHQGNFPASLDVLAGAGGAPLQASQLACPNAGKKGRGGGYVYVPGHRKSDDPNSILAYEPLGNHKKKPGGHVLLVGGAVKWIGEKQYDAEMAKVKAFQTKSPVSGTR